jgi:hypothetical protein
MSGGNFKPEVAVWAEFLHRLGWAATYSRGCLVCYGDRPLLVVCTDALGEGRLARSTDYSERRAAGKEWVGDLLVVGGHPLPLVKSYLASDPPVGLMGQRRSEGLRPDPLAPEGETPRLTYAEAGWDWAPGLWMRCDVCGQFGVYHETRSWTARPCGHDDGPWHSGSGGNVSAIGQTWAEAAYAVSRRKTLRQNDKETTI